MSTISFRNRFSKILLEFQRSLLFRFSKVHLYCSCPKFKKGVVMRVRSFELVVMEGLQPYAVRVTDSVGANLLAVIALPDGQLQ